MWLADKIRTASVANLVLAALGIRVALILYSAFHDATFPVAYTDVDYLVVSDGAAHMARGGSPFDRETYRYTPLLALVVLPNVWLGAWWGKLLLALCDVVAGWFVLTVLVGRSAHSTAAPVAAVHINSNNNNNKSSISNRSASAARESFPGAAAPAAAAVAQAKLLVSAFIWFNPVVVNVSTRGNSDIIVAALTLGALAFFAQRRFVPAGLLLGFAVHMKIYPIIYAAPFVFALLEERGLLGAAGPVLTAALATVVGAVVPTAACYAAYGQRFLDEAILYHVGRVDHRHNLSPYFLQMYLGLHELEASGSTQLTANLIAFVPQVAMLVLLSWVLRRNAAHAVAIETMLFVAFNKVCTVQYFVWYLPFLPFLFFSSKQAQQDGPGRRSSPAVLVGAPGAAVIALWVAALLLWMLTAMQLEFHGVDTFAALWLCSALFFVAQVLLAAVMVRVALRSQRLEGKIKD